MKTSSPSAQTFHLSAARIFGLGLLTTACAFSWGCSADGDGSGDSGSGGTAAGGGSDVGSSGGTATSGGNTGAGGTVAGAGGGTASGGAPGGTGCASATICDDFEGGIDPAWGIQPDSTPAPSVDASKGANGSSSSLKVVGSSQQSFVTLPVPAQAFYVRTYVNFQQSTAEMSGHGWFIVGSDNVTSGGGAQMRMGSSGNHTTGKQIDFNVYGGGCNGEKTQFSVGASDGAAGWSNTPHPAVQFDKDKWYCVEAFFDGPNNEFRYWIDGTEVPGLHVTEATMCDNWAPTYTHVKIGAGANGDIGSIWYDDLGVSTTRIGCP